MIKVEGNIHADANPVGRVLEEKLRGKNRHKTANDTGHSFIGRSHPVWKKSEKFSHRHLQD
jgi:hypothetical protein